MAASWTLLDSISIQSVQVATEAPPTLPGEGMSLEAVMAFTLWLDAGPGQTILADYGQCDVYVFDNGQWGEAPTLVMQVPPGSAGHRRISLGTVPVENQRGRFAPICNGISVSGATVTLEILATIDRRGVSKAV